VLIKQWFGVSRFVYNTTIKYLQEPGTKASWLTIKTGILNSLPEWAKPVPFLQQIDCYQRCLLDCQGSQAGL
jgi:putative transposase